MNVGLRFVSNGDRVPSVVYEKKKADTRFQTLRAPRKTNKCLEEFPKDVHKNI